MVKVIEDLTEDVLRDPDRRYARFALLGIQLRKMSPAVTTDALHQLFETTMKLTLAPTLSNTVDKGSEPEFAVEIDEPPSSRI